MANFRKALSSNGDCSIVIHKNMDLMDAIRVAKSLGCDIRYNSNNDISISHSSRNGKRLTVSGHGRKTASQALISFIRQIKNSMVEKQAIA